MELILALQSKGRESDESIEFQHLNLWREEGKFSDIALCEVSMLGSSVQIELRRLLQLFLIVNDDRVGNRSDESGNRLL